MMMNAIIVPVVMLMIQQNGNADPATQQTFNVKGRKEA
jgi:hypothetical protein